MGGIAYLGFDQGEEGRAAVEHAARFVEENRVRIAEFLYPASEPWRSQAALVAYDSMKPGQMALAGPALADADEYREELCDILAYCGTVPLYSPTTHTIFLPFRGGAIEGVGSAERASALLAEETAHSMLPCFPRQPLLAAPSPRKGTCASLSNSLLGLHNPLRANVSEFYAHMAVAELLPEMAYEPITVMDGNLGRMNELRQCVTRRRERALSDTIRGAAIDMAEHLPQFAAAKLCGDLGAEALARGTDVLLVGPAELMARYVYPVGLELDGKSYADF